MILRKRTQNRVRADGFNIVYVRTDKRRTEHQTDDAVNMTVRNNGEKTPFARQPLYIQRHTGGVNQIVMVVHNSRRLAGCA